MYFKYNDITIYYEIYGNSDKTVLILPGWGNTRNTFINIINLLKDSYKVFIIDYPSFGNSPIPNRELSIYDYAQLVSNFIKENSINNPIIIAHSFGGRIVSILSSKYNFKINKLVLMDVAGIKRRKSFKTFFKEKLYKLLKKITHLFPKIKQERLRQMLLLKFGSNDYINLPICMRKTFQNIVKEDLRKYYKKIDVETLLIWGNNDTDTPLSDGFYLNKIIKNSALIIYKNANHFSYLNYPYLTNEILKEYLKIKTR